MVEFLDGYFMFILNKEKNSLNKTKKCGNVNMGKWIYKEKTRKAIKTSQTTQEDWFVIIKPEFEMVKKITTIIVHTFNCIIMKQIN